MWLGPIGTVISVAGYYEMIPFSEITEAQWTRMLRVQLGGLTNVVRATLPDLLERRHGTVVAVSSELAIGGDDGGSEVDTYHGSGAFIIEITSECNWAIEVGYQG